MNENEIILLHKDGKSIRELSRMFDCSTTLIKKIVTDKVCNKYEGDLFIAICKLTKKEFKDFRNKSGSLTNHIQSIFPCDEIPNKYKRKKFEVGTGGYWHEKYFNITKCEKEEVITCRHCSWTSVDVANKSGQYTLHLEKEHGITISDSYLKKYEEDRVLFNSFILKKEEKDFLSKKDNSIECLICNKMMRKITNTHLKKHNTSLIEYRKKYGNTLSKTSRKKFSENSKKNNANLFRNRKTTNIEQMLMDKMNYLNIDFIKECRVGNYYYDFFIKDCGMFLETDGLYWHGHDRDGNWDPKIVKNIINDFNKTKKVNGNLFRIIEGVSINNNNLNQIQSKDSFMNFLSKENFLIQNHKLFNLKEGDVIISKDKLIGNNDYLNQKKYYKIIASLWKEFYSPEVSENFIDLNHRRTIDFKLKGLFFEEFYKSHKIKNPNITDIFNDNKKMEDICKYRLGINNKNECFDISIKNLYRGMEVSTMFNVGIFPSKKAEEIYKEFCKEGSLVYDPFSGWASRAVGACNAGVSYIGNDSNLNLEKSYKKVKKKFLNDKISLKIKDSRIIDKNIINKVDFIFTSPPFFNDEIYHENTVIYKTEQDWQNELLDSVFNNCSKYLINNSNMIIDMKVKYNESIIKSCEKNGFELVDIREYKVKNSHYNKGSGIKNQNLLVFKLNIK